MPTAICIDCSRPCAPRAKRCVPCRDHHKRAKDNQRIKDLRAGATKPPGFDLDSAIAKVAASLTSLPVPRPEALLVPTADKDMGFGPQHQVAMFSDYHSSPCLLDGSCSASVFEILRLAISK